MQEIFEYLQEKLDTILEFLTGSKKYRLGVVKERLPHVLVGRPIDPVSPPDAPCDRY